MSDFTRAPVKPVVAFTTLAALDIRLGEIVTVEDVANSNKLVRLLSCFSSGRCRAERAPASDRYSCSLRRNADPSFNLCRAGRFFH